LEINQPNRKKLGILNHSGPAGTSKVFNVLRPTMFVCDSEAGRM